MELSALTFTCCHEASRNILKLASSQFRAGLGSNWRAKVAATLRPVEHRGRVCERPLGRH